MCGDISMWNSLPPPHLFCAEWVSGSPRSSNYLGQVFVYDYSEATTSVSDSQIFQEFRTPSIVLTGPQVSKAWLCFSFYVCHTCMYVCVCTYKRMYIHMCPCVPSCHFICCEQIGAYFGYSLAAVDFNGDRWVTKWFCPAVCRTHLLCACGLPLVFGSTYRT